MSRWAGSWRHDSAIILVMPVLRTYRDALRLTRIASPRVAPRPVEREGCVEAPDGSSPAAADDQQGPLQAQDLVGEGLRGQGAKAPPGQPRGQGWAARRVLG